LVLKRELAAGFLLGAFALAAVADEGAGGSGATTIWSGVYTNAQALRGQRIYPDSCGKCHGARLDGAPDDPDMYPSPPIAGAKFLRKWNGRPLAAVFDYSRTTMPANNPGFLSPQEFADLVAYMLYVSRVPPGEHELVADSGRLAAIAISREPPR
jgi:polar amino acid transport system substrate-binding protein